jgi:phosphoglycolate phosphatase-like HAD superfamily hydrolase
VRIYNELAAASGFRPIDDPQAVRGMSLLPFLRAHGIGVLQVPLLVKRVLTRQRAELASVPLFPGVAAVLHAVRAAGGCMSVLSSNAADNIRACLGANGVLELFEAVVGYRRLFGKGRALRRFRKAHALGPSEVLYVGDEVRDVEAARHDGVAVAAVSWGYQARQLLAEHAPDYLLDRPEELAALLGVRP